MTANILPGLYRSSKADDRPLGNVKVAKQKDRIIFTFNGKKAIHLERRNAFIVMDKVLACLRRGELCDTALGSMQFRAFRDGELIKLLFCPLHEDLRNWDWIKLTESQAEYFLAEIQDSLSDVEQLRAD